MQPLVSICIPTYEQNGVGAKHLTELLASINFQMEDAEIIISDNSESDVIKNVADKFYATKIPVRYFRNPKKGAAYNTNHAINQATGDIIKIMYMDDYFVTDDGLKHFVDALTNTSKHWAISDSFWVDAANRPIKEFNARYDGRIMNGMNTIGMPSVIAFKKTALRFDATFKTSFDKEFYYRMYQMYGPPAHIAKPIVAQRIHENSLSSLQKNNAAEDHSKMMRKHKDTAVIGKSFFHRNRTRAATPGEQLPAVGVIKNYKLLCKTPSDINEHLPLLKEIAMQCEHVTEMGVRHVVSTYAFIEGTPKTLVCYDIVSSPQITAAQRLAEQMGIDLKYKVMDVLKIEIAETDFLFIDTLHDYEQIKKELQLHADKVRKFIGFHDVTSFGLKDESTHEGPLQGILPAILEFMQHNPEWKVYRYHQFNNGCLILKRDETVA